MKLCHDYFHNDRLFIIALILYLIFLVKLLLHDQEQDCFKCLALYHSNTQFTGENNNIHVVIKMRDSVQCSTYWLQKHVH